MQYPLTHSSNDVFDLELMVLWEEKRQQLHHVEEVQQVSGVQG